MGTSVPAAVKNLATLLRARTALIGPPKVAIHTVDGQWTDSEAIVLLGVQAPQSWSIMSDPGIDEQAILSGYLFTERAGNADTDADTLRDRCGALFDELVDTLHDNPSLGGAIPELFAPPLLTAATWQGWLAEEDGTSTIRIRVDWQATWSSAL
jgi:hypothetical protein